MTAGREKFLSFISGKTELVKNFTEKTRSSGAWFTPKISREMTLELFLNCQTYIAEVQSHARLYYR